MVSNLAFLKNTLVTVMFLLDGLNMHTRVPVRGVLSIIWLCSQLSLHPRILVALTLEYP